MPAQAARQTANFLVVVEGPMDLATAIFVRRLAAPEGSRDAAPCGGRTMCRLVRCRHTGCRAEGDFQVCCAGTHHTTARSSHWRVQVTCEQPTAMRGVDPSCSRSTRGRPFPRHLARVDGRDLMRMTAAKGGRERRSTSRPGGRQNTQLRCMPANPAIDRLLSRGSGYGPRAAAAGAPHHTVTKKGGSIPRSSRPSRIQGERPVGAGARMLATETLRCSCT